MIVRPLKSEFRCKLCKHEARPQIDQLLLKRSLREKGYSGKDETGRPFIFDKLIALGVDNPTEENCKTHFRKHCEVVSEEEASERIARTAEAYEALQRGDYEFEDVDEGLRFLFTEYVKEQKLLVADGQSIRLTHDHGIKLADAITRRKTNEAQQELFRALGGGIEAAFKGALGQGQQPVGELVEGEAIEEAEVVEGS